MGQEMPATDGGAGGVERAPAAQSRRPGPLPPRATANGTLRRIQEAAVVLFGERGYHAVSVRELAEAVGIRPASLYAHITSKEEVLLDLMLIGHDEHNERLRRGVAIGGDDPATQLRGLMREHVLMHATYPVLARVVNTELGSLSPANHETVMTVRRDSEELIRGVVRRGVDAGRFNCSDPWLVSAAIGSMGIRVAFWFTPEFGYTAEDVADRYAELAIKLVT
jgi:AcrR family transcriptional regulator